MRWVNKQELRQSIRNRRKQLSTDIVAAASAQISEKIIDLPEFQRAKKIAYYLPHENEINLSMIVHRAQALHKSLYLPILKDNNELLFYGVNTSTPFKKNKWGIEEPIISEALPALPSTFDVIFMPLIAFDGRGNRLGRGAGCYDRSLANIKKMPRDKRPVLIGIAYEFQKVDALIPDSWDVPMDYIVTEKTIY